MTASRLQEDSEKPRSGSQILGGEISSFEQPRTTSLRQTNSLSMKTCDIDDSPGLIFLVEDSDQLTMCIINQPSFSPIEANHRQKTNVDSSKRLGKHIATYQSAQEVTQDRPWAQILIICDQLPC
jgi:hypothetical protein